MSYIVYYSDPAKVSYPITVVDNTIYNGVGSGSLKLVGKNYPAYGQPIAENLIHILENFASSTPPDNPVEGQLWYDNATQKLRLNNGTANSANWKPLNGLYQRDTEPIDAVIGDIWVDTTRNQIFIHNGSDFSTLVGPSYSSAVSAGPIVETVFDNLGNTHQVVKFYLNGNEQAILTDAAFIPQSPPFGFSSYQTGINLVSTSILNGTSDSANFIRQNGIKVPGNSFVRNDQGQTINGQLTLGVDGNSLLIGTDPTFILERTINGSNANFLNNYRNYGTFAFNIKDSNFKTVPVLTIGGNPQQVIVASYNTSTSKSTGAFVVNGGAGIGGDLWVGGNLYFTSRSASTLTVATIVVTSSTVSTSTNSGALQIAGGVGIGGSLWIGENISIPKIIYDTDGKAGNQGDVLVSTGNKVRWTPFLFGNSSTNLTNANITGIVQIQGPVNATSTSTGSLIVAAGVGIGQDLWVGGLVTATNLYSKAISVANSGTFNTVIVNGTTASVSVSTGALVVKGGVGVAGDLYVGGKVIAQELNIQYTTVTTTLVKTDDIIQTTNNTNATTTLTGALIIAGGVGIGRNVMVGNQLYVKVGANTNPGAVAGLWPVSTQTYVLPIATQTTIGGMKVTGTSILLGPAGDININTGTLMTTATYAQFITTTATQTQLGGIIIGTNVNVAGNGTISVATATNSVLGLVSVDLNTGITIQQGRLSLSTATSVYLGGVRLGENVSARNNGTLYIDTSTLLVAQAVSITSTATATQLGGVKIGSNINISGTGTISVSTGAGYVLPTATTSTLGGIRQNPYQPNIIIDSGTGVPSLNFNIVNSTGTAVTNTWNTTTNYYDVKISVAPANTGYNVAYGTVVRLENLDVRVTTSGVAQVKAVTTSMNAFWSGYQILASQAIAMSPIVNTGAVLSTSTWTAIGTANNLASGGDTIIAHVQNQDSGNLYRVTYVHTAGVNSASAVIEKLI